MRTIATLQEPDEGSIRLGAIEVLRQKDEVRRTLGYLPQSFGFHPRARAERLLEHFAVLKGITEKGARREVVESLLRQTNLWDVRSQRLGTFSGGMRQRFGIAVALLGNPKLIIVDLECDRVPFLDDRRLKPRDRTVLRAILAEHLDDILMHVEVPDADLQTLFERLHGIAYAQAVQEDIDEMRSGMAAMFDELGVDVDVPELRADMSEEEIAVAAAHIADGVYSDQARRCDEPHRRMTKRELREEERARRFAHMRKDSIGAVYKRLVKALHPDLERDAAERPKKIGMMQEVTAAYARRDLHTLLRLEVEWIDGAQADATRLSGERLRADTELLKEQAAELEAECHALRFHPRYAALIVDGPFGLPMLIDGPSEAARLDFVIEQLRNGIEHMASSHALHEVGRAIREYRQVQKARRKQPRRSVGSIAPA
jgi:ABC-type transport system involved in cytochrome c biogenesis ATPase subunit